VYVDTRITDHTGFTSLIDPTDTSKGISADPDLLRACTGEQLMACVAEWPGMVPDGLTALEEAIVAIVEDIGDPLLKHIVNRLDDQDHDGEYGGYVEQAVLDLVARGVLRMKEDSYDHDWTYRLARIDGNHWLRTHYATT